MRYHLTPVSVFPVLFKISSQVNEEILFELMEFDGGGGSFQGPSALWKGVLPSLGYNLLVVATDNFLQDVIPMKKSLPSSNEM